MIAEILPSIEIREQSTDVVAVLPREAEMGELHGAASPYEDRFL